MSEREKQLEVAVRRAIACIEQMRPYVMWEAVDDSDGEYMEAKVGVTLDLLREALRK